MSEISSHAEQWWQVGVKVCAGFAETLIDQLQTRGCLGAAVNERDGTVVVTAYFPGDMDADAVRGLIAATLESARSAAVEVGAGTVQMERLQDWGWRDRWREHFRPSPVGPRLWIAPPWHPDTPPDRLRLEIDPGMAFGTGTHETTRMCLELLQALPAVPVWVTDIGTGSGILAIAAALLGAWRVVALDTDPDAIAAAHENAMRNQVAEKIEFRCADFTEVHPEPSPLILANLTSSVFLSSIPELSGWITPGGCAILSGIGTVRAEEVRAAFSSHGFQVADQHSAGEWVAFTATLDSR